MLSSLKALLDLSLQFRPVAGFTGGNGPRGYPEWKSKRKTKGRRDKSLKQRSNRRKAAGAARRIR